MLGAYYLVSAEVGGVTTPVFGEPAATIGLASTFLRAGLGLSALSLVVIALAAARKL